MKELEISEAKRIQLEILDRFHNFCEENSLQYSLYAGSLIGAIRHHGFIPWDDDIDIIMPREDYERFRLLAREGAFDSSRFKVYDYKIDNGYNYPFIKFADKTTLQEELTLQGINIGLHIDIFPLDGMPDNLFIANIYIRILTLLKYFGVISGLGERRTSRRSILKVLLIILLKAFTLGTRGGVFYRFMEWIAKLYSYKHSRWAGNLMWGYGLKEKVPSYVYKSGTVLQFEGKLYNVMNGYDEYLTCVYGDYMTPPPFEKRIPRHIYRTYQL